VADEANGTGAVIVHIRIQTVVGIGAQGTLLTWRPLIQGTDVQFRCISGGSGTVDSCEAAGTHAGVLRNGSVGTCIAVVAVEAVSTVGTWNRVASIQLRGVGFWCEAVWTDIFTGAQADVVVGIHGQTRGTVLARETVAWVGVGAVGNRSFTVETNKAGWTGTGVRPTSSLDLAADTAVLAGVGAAPGGNSNFAVEASEAALTLTQP